MSRPCHFSVPKCIQPQTSTQIQKRILKIAENLYQLLKYFVGFFAIIQILIVLVKTQIYLKCLLKLQCTIS